MASGSDFEMFHHARGMNLQGKKSPTSAVERWRPSAEIIAAVAKAADSAPFESTEDVQAFIGRLVHVKRADGQAG